MENENSEIRTHISLRDRVRNWRIQSRVPVQTSVDASAFEILLFGFISPWIWIPIFVALNSMIIGVALYWGFGLFGGLGALTAVLIAESPVIYFVIKEILREYRMLPAGDKYETKPESYRKAMDQYVGMIIKSREEKKKP